MLKLLKWDFINYIRRYYWVYIGLAVAFLLTTLPFTSVMTVFDGISMVYGVFFYFLTVIVSIAMTISWLRNKSAQLELSVPVKTWKKLLCKLALSTCIIASTLLLTYLLWLQAGVFKIDLIAGVSIYFQLLLFIITIVATVMFSYITAKSFAPTRNIAGLITVLIFIGIYALLIYLAFVPMNFTIRNAEVISVFNTTYLANHPSQSWLQPVLSIALPAAMIAILFFASSALLKKKFERY